MTDPFKGFNPGPNDVPSKCWAITLDDNADQPLFPSYVRATGAGIVKLQAVGSTTPVSYPVKDGEIIRLRIRKIWSTGTSGVTGLIGSA